MILILEGLNGVGKTSIANAVSEQTGIPVYRAFRQGKDVHWGEGSKLEVGLLEMGVPLNTHVEDLYAADLLATFKGVNVILDRSMISAIAYGVPEKVLSKAQADLCFNYWLDRLWERRDIFYVYMHCHVDVARIRSNRVIKDVHHRAEVELMFHACWMPMANRFQHMDMDTTDIGFDAVLAEITSRM